MGQAAEGNFLTPKLVGDKVGLHPVWLMFALSAFGVVFGFVGRSLAHLPAREKQRGTRVGGVRGVFTEGGDVNLGEGRGLSVRCLCSVPLGCSPYRFFGLG